MIYHDTSLMLAIDSHLPISLQLDAADVVMVMLNDCVHSKKE